MKESSRSASTAAPPPPNESTTAATTADIAAWTGTILDGSNQLKLPPRPFARPIATARWIWPATWTGPSRTTSPRTPRATAGAQPGAAPPGMRCGSCRAPTCAAQPARDRPRVRGLVDQRRQVEHLEDPLERHQRGHDVDVKLAVFLDFLLWRNIGCVKPFRQRFPKVDKDIEIGFFLFCHERLIDVEGGGWSGIVGESWRPALSD